MISFLQRAGRFWNRLTRNVPLAVVLMPVALGIALYAGLTRGSSESVDVDSAGASLCDAMVDNLRLAPERRFEAPPADAYPLFFRINRLAKSFCP